MLSEDYERLKNDIKTNGFDPKQPIYLYEDAILDGYNRQQVCDELGVRAFYEDFIGSNIEAINFVMRTNKRRNLTSSQWAAIAVEADEIIQAIRKATEKDRIRKQKENADNQYSEPSVNKLTEPKLDENKSRTDHKVASTFNTNRTYINEATKLRDEKPELFEQVKSGEKTITQAVRDVKRENIITGLASIEAKEAKAIEGVYDVIVIDPPWPMEKIERDVRPNQTVFDYPTMQESELNEIKIPNTNDCHLWLWTTHKFLPMALRLLDRWGFKYICTFVWHKPGGFQPVGLPQYNCEFVLYARKGTPIFIDTKSFPACFEAPRGAHSEKPELFYDTIRRVTAGRRIDMFGRRNIEGFDSWGKEADDE